ncbi:hypothetical protein ACLMJK_008630 [Lecanora helva]
MIQPQPPQQLTYPSYSPSPYAPQPQQLQPAYGQPPPHQQQQPQQFLAPQPQVSSPPSRKRKAPGTGPPPGMSTMPPIPTGLGDPGGLEEATEEGGEEIVPAPAPKKSRTNTPWSPAEEQRLKVMRDAGNTWGEIAKDMHYADFAEDDSTALLAAIKEYEANKWKVIGQKVGKPAKACEQYAKEHFGGRM